MPFENALVDLKAGCRLTRKYWVRGSYVQINYGRIIYFGPLGAPIDAWAPLQIDILADDWLVLD